jgi:hypothetical protein
MYMYTAAAWDALEQRIEAAGHVGAALRWLQRQPLHVVRQRLRRQPEDLQAKQRELTPMCSLLCSRTPGFERR